MVSFSHRIGGNRKRKYYRRMLIKIATNRVFDCHLSPEWRQIAIKTLFLAILIRVRRLIRAFSIAAYPV